MNVSKALKTVLVFALTIMLFALTGCMKADIAFNRDGSGVCTVVIQKEDGVTKTDITNKLSEIFKGVETQSQREKLKLKSLEENDDSFTAVIKFNMISEIKGLGSYTYETGESFGSQLVQRNLFSQLSKGNIPTRNLTNYNNSTFKINDKIAINPKGVDGSSLNPDDFKDENNSYYSEKNIFFTFVLCGIENLSSITFEFPGEILICSSLNAQVKDGNKLVITPQKVKAQETGIRNGEAFLEVGEYSLFAGYVVFKLKTNVTPYIVIGAVVLVLGALITLGFTTGAFKRFFKSKTWGKIVKNRVLYLFVLPGFVLFSIFNYAPMVGIIVAFKNYTVDGGIFGSEWANNFGFEHFITLFTHPGSEFGLVFRNTIVMALLKFVFGFPAAIILALMFNALKNGIFKKSVQTISYLPYFVSWVVVSNIVYLFFSANGGIVNKVILALNVEKIRFYIEPKYWWGIITGTSVWKSLGWGTIVYLAAITSINPDLYEAASIDGAGAWRKLWTVTLPGMMPVIGIQLILSAGNLIKDDFDQIFSLVGESNYELRDVTEVFSSLVYRNLRGGPKGFSSSTAISLVQSIISLGLVLGADKIVRKTDNPGLW